MPVYFESQAWSAPPPSTIGVPGPGDLPEALLIPLPPSAAGSEYDEEMEGSIAPTGSAILEDPQVRPMSGEYVEQDSEIGTRGVDAMDGEDSSAPAEDPGPTSPPRCSDRDPEQSTSLQELTRIILEDAHEVRRLQEFQSHVQELLHHCGVTGRAIPQQSYLHRQMLNAFTADNGPAFASLYTQSVQVQNSCISNYNVVEDPAEARNNPLTPIRGPPASWIDIFPQDGRHGVLGMLSRIRSDADFLANRIASLSTSQLNSLARPQRQAVGTESILRTTGGHKSSLGNFRSTSHTAKEPIPSQETLQHDPLFLLLHCVFDTSPGPWCQESLRQRDVWSTTCAQLLEAGDPGSDEFCMTIFDAFANKYPWPRLPQLEGFLSNLVHSGTFISNPPVERGFDFSRPDLSRNGSSATTASVFFSDALTTLIDLLTAGPSGGELPIGVLELAHATLGKIEDPEKRVRAHKFLIRWYCTSFVSNALIYPEVSILRAHGIPKPAEPCDQTLGIMVGRHISAGVRQKLFHELALWLQKSVFDALFPWYVTPPSTLAVVSVMSTDE